MDFGRLPWTFADVVVIRLPAKILGKQERGNGSFDGVAGGTVDYRYQRLSPLTP